MLLINKTVLVTGAGRGIGYEIVKTALREAAKMVAPIGQWVDGLATRYLKMQKRICLAMLSTNDPKCRRIRASTKPAARSHFIPTPAISSACSAYALPGLAERALLQARQQSIIIYSTKTRRHLRHCMVNFNAIVLARFLSEKSLLFGAFIQSSR